MMNKQCPKCNQWVATYNNNYILKHSGCNYGQNEDDIASTITQIAIAEEVMSLFDDSSSSVDSSCSSDTSSSDIGGGGDFGGGGTSSDW
jgi:uncharacterized membrane protein YgcG